MGKIVYYHSLPQSFESKLIQFFLGLFGMKKQMERKIINNGYVKEPASIPKSMLRKFNVEINEFEGRKAWALSPKKSESNTTILYLHGGAYYANITNLHWQFIEQLLNSKSSTFIVPDYPLAPESTCKDAHQFLDAVYAKLISDYPSNQIIFMGDSAGAGLALGFAQKIKSEGIKQPEQIILLSPWLDVSMSNPEIDKVEGFDKILSVKGLRIAGKNFAGDFDVTDYRVSPIYGDFCNLGRISIFIGTNDILIADAQKFKGLMEGQHIDINYFEYPKMFHDWMIVTNINESKDVIGKVVQIIRSSLDWQ
jgi:acetyl esterase/lipase